VDQGEPVAELLGLLHEVGDEHDRRAVPAYLVDEPPHVAAGLRVEPGRQLVEERHSGSSDEGQRDREPLLLAAGEGGVPRVQLGAEPEPFGQPDTVDRVVVERGVEVQRLPHGELGLEPRLLELDADRPGRAGTVGGGVDAGDPDGAFRRRLQAGDALHGRRLAGAVGAEDAEDLALGDIQVEVVDGGRRAVLLVQSAYFDEGHVVHSAEGRHRS
jgi:hypothetical protein